MDPQQEAELKTSTRKTFLTEYAVLKEKPVEDHTRFFESVPSDAAPHRKAGAYQAYVRTGIKSFPGGMRQVAQ